MMCYPDLTAFYGPLVNFKTEKFEHTHAFIKGLIKTSNNSLNVPYSLAKRYQLAQPFMADLEDNPVEGSFVNYATKIVSRRCLDIKCLGPICSI
ncbi:hypothetical protein HUG17_0211 [Dermatophagoides farinae]|uniref:Uncharacterized protein n=1 Tax=Dermatophagoides farinae TaxID=6954 RepID=A0A9D4P5V6_DERFA|nr:hypothetical protein HUG17_0211 [Dermatophagoides farinae]